MLDRHTQFQLIEIWQPRWHDRKVLIAKHKVGVHNKIRFTKAPTLRGEFYVAGKDLITYPIEDNGKIECYAIPLGELKPMEHEVVNGY